MRTGREERWSTADRPEDPTSAWEDVLSATHLQWTVRVDTDEAGGAAAPFEASARRWWIDDLALVDCECGPCSGTRQRRQIAATDGEFVVVLLTRAGRETVEQGGTQARLRPGDAVVWDSTVPARFRVHEPLAKRSLLVPRAALDEVGGRAHARGGVVLDRDSPATQLLTAYLDVLSRTLPGLGEAALRAARNATLELLVGALRPAGEAVTTGTAQPALRAAMERYIERHLADGAVSPAAIAAAHGVSTRTVNRVFEAGGATVGEVTRLRRLARAREDLAASDRPVAAIAHRWGFADASHLSRSFKARYGTSPSEFRLAARAAGAPVHEAGAGVHGPLPGAAETGTAAAGT